MQYGKELANQEEKYSEVIRVFKDLKEVRERYEQVWKRINELVVPRRSDFDWENHNSKSYDVNMKIYDNHAGQMVNNAADSLLGNTMNRGNLWFKLHSPDPDLDRMRAFRLHIEQVEYVLYSLLRNSNVYEVGNDAVLDAMTIGHTCVYREVDYDNKRIMYSARHPKEIYFSEGRWGRVDTVVRRFWMEAREVVKEYKKDGYLTEKFLKEADDKPYEMISLIHLCRPREDRDLSKIDAKNKAFESTTIIEDHGCVVRESGYDRFPYPAVWRWRVNTGEIYSRSPSWDALPDIIRLQEISKSMMKFVQLSVEPPLMYPLEMKGKIDLRPRGMTPYTDPNRGIKRTHDLQNAYPLGLDIIQNLKEQISQAYYADVFQMLSLTMDRDKTATEVQELSAERSALLTAVTERFNAEYSGPIIADVYDIAYENGWLPEVPPELARYDLRVQIEFLGPLAQNQRRFFLNTGFNTAITHAMTLGQLFPESLDVFDPEKIARHSAYITGMSEKVYRSPQEVARIRRAREEMMEQQMQAQQQQANAQAYGQMNKRPEPGSPAEEMMNG